MPPSCRQLEVLKLRAAGLTNKAAADLMKISENRASALFRTAKLNLMAHPEHEDYGLLAALRRPETA